MTSSRCSPAGSPPPGRCCASPPSSSKGKAPPPDLLTHRASKLAASAFLAVALGAIAARFWALATQPGGLYADEAAEGWDATRLLDVPGFHPVFFNDDGGREAWFAYMVALAFRWFGTSAVVLRATAAAVGVAGVAAVWLATRRFGRWPAIVAMAWAAGSLWLVAVSRDGFRTILVVPVAALALATMLRWGDHTERRWALASGATAALGLWTYQPLKLSPVLVLLWLLWVRHADRERYRRLRAGIRWAVLAYLVVAAPMIWTAITDFNNYFGRGASVIALNPDSSSPDSYPVHVLRTLGMFFVAGDPNARHNVDGLPLLGPLLCLPFALGLWRAWRLRADHGHAALLLGLGVFLVPPLLANEGAAPHFLRILGMAPYLAALIGIGCLEAVRLLRPLGGRTSVWAVGVAASGMLIALGAVSTLTYLDRPVSARYAPYSFADVELAAAADRGPGTVAIIDDYHALVVRFLDYGRLPTIVAPGSRLAHPAVYSLIVARSQSAIARATDRRTAARAGVAARDPTGTPVVWVVVP